MVDECRACVATGAGHHVEHAGRQEVLADLGHQEDGQRSVLGGLQHDSVPRGEGGRDLEPGDHQGRVPGQDRADDAERFQTGVLQLRGPGGQRGALHLPRDAAEIAEQIDEGGHLRSRLGPQGVPGVHGGHLCKFFSASLDGVSDLEQYSLTGREVLVAPGGERCPRRGDRQVDVGAGAAGNAGQDLAPVTGADDVPPVAFDGSDPLAADEHQPGRRGRGVGGRSQDILLGHDLLL
jgi:hypothetical protein